MSIFKGFDKPEQNYSKLPHSFIAQLPVIDTLAELKVVLYLLRHTWGFSEYGKPKKITTDEFMNGRKKSNGERMDGGTGLSNNSVITGLEKATEHGFILVETDDTDKARIEKHYCLNMSDMQTLHTETDVNKLHSNPQGLHSDCEESAQRSEKETKKDTNGKKLIIINPITAQLFLDAFGQFNSQREQERWGTLYDSVGPDRARELIAWAEKKEIHLANRPSLVDALETAAKKWQTSAQRNQTPAQRGDRKAYIEGKYADYIEH
jgi:hypothetical protein